MGRISRKRFERLAEKTGAVNCDRFDWCYKITECCSMGGHDAYGRCLVMDGKTCEYLESLKYDEDCPSEHWLFNEKENTNGNNNSSDTVCDTHSNEGVMNKFVINLDNLSREELVLLVQNLKRELEDKQEDYNVSGKCWEFLCQTKDRKIRELTFAIEQAKENLELLLNKMKGDNNEQ